MGEFMGRELAHENPTGGDQPRRGGGIRIRNTVFRRPGMPGGPNTRGIVNVLEPERNAMQRTQIPAGGNLLLRLAGCRQCLFRRYCQERVKLRVERFDPGQKRLGQRHRRQQPRLYLARGCRNGQVCQIVVHEPLFPYTAPPR